MSKVIALLLLFTFDHTTPPCCFERLSVKFTFIKVMTGPFDTVFKSLTKIAPPRIFTGPLFVIVEFSIVNEDCQRLITPPVLQSAWFPLFLNRLLNIFTEFFVFVVPPVY